MNPRKLSAALSPAVVPALGFAVLLLAAGAAHADHAPRYRADGIVMHGDWGLYRPGHGAPWIEGQAGWPAPRHGLGHYFPSNRRDPGAYRRRPPVDRAPIPAEPYFRSWGAQSWGAQSQNPDPDSATVYAPFEPPEVIYAPRPGRPHRNR